MNVSRTQIIGMWDPSKYGPTRKPVYNPYNPSTERQDHRRLEDFPNKGMLGGLDSPIFVNGKVTTQREIEAERGNILGAQGVLA